MKLPPLRLRQGISASPGRRSWRTWSIECKRTGELCIQSCRRRQRIWMFKLFEVITQKKHVFVEMCFEVHNYIRLFVEMCVKLLWEVIGLQQKYFCMVVEAHMILTVWRLTPACSFVTNHSGIVWNHLVTQFNLLKDKNGSTNSAVLIWMYSPY